MKWIKKIWAKLFGSKKKPVDTIQDFQVLQKATENWEEPEPHTEQSFEPPKVKRVFDYTPNPNKYWRRFKRGDNYYWKKFYAK